MSPAPREGKKPTRKERNPINTHTETQKEGERNQSSESHNKA